MKREDLTLEYLHECFTYDKENGELYWKERPRSHFSSDRGMKTANSSCGWKIVGSIQKSRDNGDYKVVRLNRVGFYISNLVWMFETGELPSGRIFYSNNNALDTRFENLKLSNKFYIQKSREGRFIAMVDYCDKYISVGTFENKSSAITTCKKALSEIENGTFVHNEVVSDAGFKGVSCVGDKFKARFKGIHLGLFNTAEEAHETYLAAKSK